MSATTRGYQHFTLLYCIGRKDPFLIAMRRDDAIRLQELLQSSAKGQYRFFCCDTVDGKTIALNLSCLQAIHFRFEPSAFPEDMKRYSGGIKVFLRERKEPIKLSPGAPDQVSAFIAYLETGADPEELYLALTDSEGEQLMVNIAELVLIEVPSHIVIEGERELTADVDE